MKNSAEQGGCYPQRPKAEVDNTLRDLQNSSYDVKDEQKREKLLSWLMRDTYINVR